jgi:hypothetical protein
MKPDVVYFQVTCQTCHPRSGMLYVDPARAEGEAASHSTGRPGHFCAITPVVAGPGGRPIPYRGPLPRRAQ